MRTLVIESDFKRSWFQKSTCSYTLGKKSTCYKDSLQPLGLQHTRPLCPSPSPKVCPNSCPLHWWCHPAISSSDALFSFCPWSFPASGTFPMSWLDFIHLYGSRLKSEGKGRHSQMQGIRESYSILGSPMWKAVYLIKKITFWSPVQHTNNSGHLFLQWEL